MTFAVVGGGPTGVEIAGQIGELARDTLKRRLPHDRPADRTHPPDRDRRPPAHHLPEVAVRTGGALAERKGVTPMLAPPSSASTPIGDRRAHGRRDRAHPHPYRGVGGGGDRLADGGDARPAIGGGARPRRPHHRRGRPHSPGSPGGVRPRRHGARPRRATARWRRYRASRRWPCNRAATPPRRSRGACARSQPHDFRYHDKGNLATIGRGAAVADIKGLHLSGFLAWLTWLFVHLWYLVGFQNRAARVHPLVGQLLHPRPRPRA